MISRSRAWVFFLLVLGPVALPATAKDPGTKHNPYFDNRWSVFAGGFLPEFETEVQFDSKIAIGAIIRLEQDLGLDEEVQTFIVGARYRFNPHHQIDLSMTQFNRDSRRAVDLDVDFGDLQFRAGALVQTRFDTSWFKVKWKYDAAQSDDLAAGFSAGLSTFDIDLGLNGVALIQDPDDPDFNKEEFAAEDASFVAPIPVVGMFIDWAITPRWLLRTGGDMIWFSIEGHEARVLELTFNSEFYFTRLFAIGFGVTSVEIDYRQETEGKRLSVRYNIRGLSAYLTFAF